jgi:hypothetical protein
LFGQALNLLHACDNKRDRPGLAFRFAAGQRCRRRKEPQAFVRAGVRTTRKRTRPRARPQYQQFGALDNDAAVGAAELTAAGQHGQAIGKARRDARVDESLEVLFSDHAAGTRQAEEQLGAHEGVRVVRTARVVSACRLRCVLGRKTRRVARVRRSRHRAAGRPSDASSAKLAKRRRAPVRRGHGLDPQSPCPRGSVLEALRHRVASRAGWAG